MPAHNTAYVKVQDALLQAEAAIHAGEQAHHLRVHLTDGRWHDDCRWCRTRRVYGGTGVRSLYDDDTKDR